MKLDFIPRTCPLCGGEDARVLVEATLDEGRLTASAFASRKLPEYMHSRMVECNLCGMLYANPVLRQETLADAYKDASFDSGAESRLAAVTYRALLEPHLAALPSRTSALDIGAGDGAFVEELLALGFTDVVGVEPSKPPSRPPSPPFAAILNAESSPRNNSRRTSLDLITCFQVIEHVWDPVKIARDALALVEAGRTVLHCRARPPCILRPRHGNKVADLRHRAPATLRSGPPALRCCEMLDSIRSR